MLGKFRKFGFLRLSDYLVSEALSVSSFTPIDLGSGSAPSPPLFFVLGFLSVLGLIPACYLFIIVLVYCRSS
jgi:hypothetical protein